MKRFIWCLLITLTGLSIQVQAQVSLNGTALYDKPIGQWWPLKNITIWMSQDSTTVFQTTTDNAGYFEFSNIPSGTYTLTATTIKPGAYYGSTDALGVMKHFVGMQLLSGNALTAADVNNDHFVNSIDALFISRRFVGQITSFPSGDWYFEKITIDINGTLVTQNIKGLCYGDVNRSGNPQ